jgi:hypothetical protein
VRWKRFGVPAVTGVVVFGAVTAFAATFTVSSKSVVAGNATVNACNATASVTYSTIYSSSLPGYTVTTTPITTGASCTTMAYKVTLMGASNVSLGEKTGSLDASGAASPDFTTSAISVALVTGVAVTITG